MELVQNSDDPKLLLMERSQMRKFMLKHPYESVQEMDNELGIILINYPLAGERCLTNLNVYRPPNALEITGEELDAVAKYKYNQITSMDDLNNAIKEIAENHSRIKNLAALRIKAIFHILLEYTGTSGKGGFYETADGTYVKYALSIEDASCKAKIIPYTFRLPDIITEKQHYENYINSEINKMLQFNLNSSSSTRYIGITGVTFEVNRLRNTGNACEDIFVNYNHLLRNRNLWSCTAVKNCCVLECLCIVTDKEKYEKLKHSERSMTK
jgi:hypothetical protein